LSVIFFINYALEVIKLLFNIILFYLLINPIAEITTYKEPCKEDKFHKVFLNNRFCKCDIYLKLYEAGKCFSNGFFIFLAEFVANVDDIMYIFLMNFAHARSSAKSRSSININKKLLLT